MSEFAKKLIIPLLPSGVLRLLRSRHYIKKFAALSGNEEPEMVTLKNLISKDDVVLDIGANFGAYTKIMSELVGAHGKVHSFEPIPEVFGYLKNNIAKQDIKNVVLHNCALAEKSGTAQFSIPKFDHSGENFYQGHLTDSDGDITVQVNALDEMTFDKKVALVKCDVENAEFVVLSGAKKFIEEHKPVWMIEINYELDAKEGKQIIDFLLERGYQMKYMDKGQLVDYKTEPYGVNYFFVPV